MRDDLPEGWTSARLAQLCTKPQYGWTTRAKKHGRGVKLLRTTDISDGRVDWSAVPVCVDVPLDTLKYRLFPGDIVVSRAGSVGLSHMLTGDVPEAVFASYLIRFRPLGPISGNFIRLFLNSPKYWDAVSQGTAGIALQNINASKLAGIGVPLPPLLEQQRLVEKADALLDQVNQVKARLDRVPVILKKFRRSVLAAACSGALTQEWRTRHGEAPEAARLIEKQRDRHRNAWEHWRSQSTSRKTARYEVPNVAWRDEPEDLPSSWTWARLGFLGHDPLNAVQTGPFGALLHRDQFVKCGVPVIAVGNLTGIGFTEEGLYFITPQKAAELDRFDVNAGDLLFARSGATLGKVCVAPAHVKDWRMTGHILRARLWRGAVLPELAAFALWGSPAVLEQVSESIRGVTRPGYNTSLLEEIHLPIPPLDEQAKIVEQVGKLFDFADAIERRVHAASTSTTKLPQAILSRAFSGELVPTEAELARFEHRAYETAKELLTKVTGLSTDSATEAKPRRSRTRKAG